MPLLGPCQRGARHRPAVQGTWQLREVATAGALDAAADGLIVRASPAETGTDVIGLPHRLDRHCGPEPGCGRLSVVRVRDSGLVHTSKTPGAALAARS